MLHGGHVGVLVSEEPSPSSRQDLQFMIPVDMMVRLDENVDDEPACNTTPNATREICTDSRTDFHRRRQDNLPLQPRLSPDLRRMPQFCQQMYGFHRSDFTLFFGERTVDFRSTVPFSYPPRGQMSYVGCSEGAFQEAQGDP